jgi:hypothetical protein
LLEQHYHFRLKDFYEYNARSFSYDNTPIIQMQRASEALEQYAALVESQGKMLEQQQSVIEKLQKH